MGCVGQGAVIVGEVVVGGASATGGAAQGSTGYTASGGCVVRNPHQKSCLTNPTWGGFQQVLPHLPPMAPICGIPWTPAHEEAMWSALEAW